GPAPRAYRMWTVLRVPLALAALAVAYHGQRLLEGRLQITRGTLWFVAAAVILIIADLRRDRSPASAPDGAATAQSAWLWWGLLAVAFGLGCFYRFYELTSAPWGVWFDEAQNGLVAQRILDDPNYRPVFIGEWSQLPALFFYVWAAFIKVFGLNI